MSTLHIQLFTKFSVRRDEQYLSGFDSRKVQELFCYLLLHQKQFTARESIASILWPDTTTAQSKKSLRQVLWQLQSALGSQNDSVNERVLLIELEWVQINPAADIWLDVAVLEQAYELVQKIRGQDIDAPIAQRLQDAVELYQSPLLEGWYQDWCLLERERLQNMYIALLDKLMSYCETHFDYESSISYGTRIMCYDRGRERTHQRLMRLYYLLDDRAAALRQYERCAAALEEELGVGPSKSTQALYQQIQADQLNSPVSTLKETDPAIQAITPSLVQLLSNLSQFQQTLTGVQDQVQQSIQQVELMLDASNNLSLSGKDDHKTLKGHLNNI